MTLKPSDAALMHLGATPTLLPPAPHLCQACAVDHTPDVPHDAKSLHYQYWFYLREQAQGREPRWPTWTDAIAHCDPETRETWTRELRARGADL